MFVKIFRIAFPKSNCSVMSGLHNEKWKHAEQKKSRFFMSFALCFYTTAFRFALSIYKTEIARLFPQKEHP